MTDEDKTNLFKEIMQDRFHLIFLILFCLEAIGAVRIRINISSFQYDHCFLKFQLTIFLTLTLIYGNLLTIENIIQYCNKSTSTSFCQIFISNQQMTDKLNPNISQTPFNPNSPSQHLYPQLKPQNNSQQAKARQSSISSASSLIPPSITHPPKPIKKSSKISAIMMILSCISWVTGYIYSNDNNLHPIETSVLRGFLIMIVSFGFCAYMGIPLKVNKGQQGIVMKRNFIFWLQGFVMPAIQFYLPLGIIHTIGSTGSIFVCIFQYIFEKKKPHMRQAIGMCLTFTGIILTANGNMLTKWLNPDYQFITDFHNYHSNDPKSMAICSLLFTIFQCFWAYGVYSTNTMQSSPFVVNFLFSLKLYFTSSLLYPYILPLTGSQVSAPVFYQGLLWTGVLFAIAQTCFIISLSMAENIGITVMLSSFTIVVAYGASVWRYGEEINAFCLMGAIMVMGGLWRILVS